MTSGNGSPPGSVRVFISYRHSDCQAQANGLHDGLVHRLPEASIFMDIDSIPYGVDFQQHIAAEIRSCDVVLVLIGDEWLSTTDETGARRLDNAEDFVRLELESALAIASVRVVPVLVDGATMPRRAELPEAIQHLARLNAIELSDRRWKADVEKLAEVIEALGRSPGAEARDGVVGPHTTDRDSGASTRRQRTSGGDSGAHAQDFHPLRAEGAEGTDPHTRHRRGLNRRHAAGLLVGSAALVLLLLGVPWLRDPAPQVDVQYAVSAQEAARLTSVAQLPSLDALPATRTQLTARREGAPYVPVYPWLCEGRTDLVEGLAVAPLASSERTWVVETPDDPETVRVKVDYYPGDGSALVVAQARNAMESCPGPFKIPLAGGSSERYARRAFLAAAPVPDADATEMTTDGFRDHEAVSVMRRGPFVYSVVTSGYSTDAVNAVQERVLRELFRRSPA